MSAQPVVPPAIPESWSPASGFAETLVDKPTQNAGDIVTPLNAGIEAIGHSSLDVHAQAQSVEHLVTALHKPPQQDGATDETIAAMEEFSKQLNTMGEDLTKVTVTTPPKNAAAPEVDDILETWRQAADAGHFTFASKVGQWWSRAVANDKSLKMNYDKIKGMPAKRQFRQAWCEGKYNDAKRSRIHTKEQFVEENDEGGYLPFVKIVEKEGGDATALEAAKNFVMAAMQAHKNGETHNGKPYFKWFAWQKRVKILYTEDRVRSGDRESWQKRSEQEQLGADNAVVARAPALTDVQQGTNTGDNQRANHDNVDDQGAGQVGKRKMSKAQVAAAAGEGSASKKGKKGGKRGTKESKPTDLLAEALSLRKIMRDAMTNSQDLLTTISTNPVYQWAIPLIAPLAEARKTVEKARSGNSFLTSWTVEEQFAQWVRKRLAMMSCRHN